MINKLTSFTFLLAAISVISAGLSMFANLLVASLPAYIFWHITLASSLAVFLMLVIIAILSLVMSMVHRYTTFSLMPS